MWGPFDRPRLVIARRWSGLGDCLISLTAAWAYARATGRTLAIDWRHSTYRTGANNLFDEVFEPVAAIAGVPVVSGNRVAWSYAGPYWPAGWNRRAIRDAKSHGERGNLALSLATMARGEDVDARTVVFDDCLASGAPGPEVQRSIFASLMPRPAIRSAVEQFVAANEFKGRHVLAVHVRRGNIDSGDHFGHWRHPGRSMFRLTQAIEAVRRQAAESVGEPLLLLCTDSAEVEGLLRAAFPRLIIRPKAMHGAAELHRGDHAAAGLFDAAVEMLLLGRSDVLIRFPANSYFSHWGAVMKPPLAIELSGLVPGGLEAAIH